MSDKSTLSVRISSELKQKLVHEAQKLDMTITDLVEFKLNGSAEKGSEPIINNNSLNEIKTLLENSPALKENEGLKDILHHIIRKNDEILKNINGSTDGGTVILDEAIKQKLLGILEIMKMEDVRYQKGEETFIASPKTVDEVLNIIIHNYHSLIVNEVI